MDKKIKGRNPYWKLGAIKYIHKNKKKYNRKNMDDNFEIEANINKDTAINPIRDIAKMVEDGIVDPLKAFLALKEIENKAKEYKKKIEDIALDEIAKYGREGVDIDGYSLNLKRSAGRWDFKHIEEIVETEKHLKELKEKHKGSYKQTANKITSIGEGGEVITPAIFKEGKDIISITKNNG